METAKSAESDRNARVALERRLLQRQSGRCFICDETIDSVLHEGQLDIDHIQPRAEGGPDQENNLAITHATCNRRKGAADLRVARRMAEFERLQTEAQQRGDRGANLGHVLKKHGGAVSSLRLKRSDGRVEFLVAGDQIVHEAALYTDPMSGMEYFFAVLPLANLFHDDRINPRAIGPNIRGLIEEFMKRRPQLHIALAWWSPGDNGDGQVKVFDGQHKAAAQILLGATELPVRIFVEPDLNVLLQANTNAGDKLRQVAFDVAVLRHLGSTLFTERVHQYQSMKGLRETEYSFSERDLVSFFKGEHREMLRYILDSVRDSVTHNKENRLMEFVEWSGKMADRPLAYNTIERTFFKEFIGKKPLETRIDEGLEQGENPRIQEREQLVRLMNLFADTFFVSQWDPDIGGRRLENRVQKGEAIPESHLRAWRIAREEILGNVMAWTRLVIENFYAFMGQAIDREAILQQRLSDELWRRIELFLRSLAGLPCWVDRNLSLTVFGAKQPLDFWFKIFKTGVAPNNVRVLAKPLDITEMIQETSPRLAALS